MEPPESIVHAVDANLAGAAAAFLIADKPLDHHERCDGGESGRERGIRLEIRRKLLTEKAGRYDELIGAAETMEDEVAETAADRIANQERAGEHGDRRGNAGDDGKVGTPVIGEPANNEAAEGISHSTPSLPTYPNTYRRPSSAPTTTRPPARAGEAAIPAPVSNSQIFLPDAESST